MITGQLSISICYHVFLTDNRIGSVVYTRWGKKTCPSGAVLVHSGTYMYMHILPVIMFMTMQEKKFLIIFSCMEQKLEKDRN